MKRPFFPGFVAAALAIVMSALGCGGPDSGEPAEADSKAQDKFFVAVGSGDPQRVMNLMHPSLKEELDEPLLADWMKAVNQSLGEYKGMSWTDWNTSWKIENGVKRFEAKGTFNFAKGDAQADFVFVGDKLVKFNVDSKALPKGWFHGPSDAKLYIDRGADFLQRLYAGEYEQAYDLTDKRFRDAVKLEVLQHANEEIRSELGKVAKIEYDGRQWSDQSGGRLVVYYRIEGDRQVDGVNRFLYANASFAFDGLKGFLAGFNNGAAGVIELSPEQGQEYEARESAFIEALAAGDVERINAAVDEAVRRQVDPPVLAAWLEALAQNRGAFQEVKEIKRETAYVGGRKTTHSQCTLAYERGDVGLDLELKDSVPDRAMGFQLDTELIEGWTEKLDASSYQQQAKDFVGKMIGGDAEAAFPLMADALQEAVPLEKLSAMSANLKQDLGAVKSIETGAVEFPAGEQTKLAVPCEIECEQKKTTGVVRFALIGPAFKMIGFDINPGD